MRPAWPNARNSVRLVGVTRVPKRAVAQNRLGYAFEGLQLAADHGISRCLLVNRRNELDHLIVTHVGPRGARFTVQTNELIRWTRATLTFAETRDRVRRDW